MSLKQPESTGDAREAQFHMLNQCISVRTSSLSCRLASTPEGASTKDFQAEAERYFDQSQSSFLGLLRLSSLFPTWHIEVPWAPFADTSELPIGGVPWFGKMNVDDLAIEVPDVKVPELRLVIASSGAAPNLAWRDMPPPRGQSNLRLFHRLAVACVGETQDGKNSWQRVGLFHQATADEARFVPVPEEPAVAWLPVAESPASIRSFVLVIQIKDCDEPGMPLTLWNMAFPVDGLDAKDMAPDSARDEYARIVEVSRLLSPVGDILR